MTLSGSGPDSGEPNHTAGAGPGPASRRYSVLRLYTPIEGFPDAPPPATLPRTLAEQAAAEAAEMEKEFEQLLLTREEREQRRRTEQTRYRVILEEQGFYYACPEQPEARIPETARLMHEQLGDDMLARFISPDSITEAQAYLDEEQPAGFSGVPTVRRQMWAGPAMVPLPWIIMVSSPDAPVVPEHGIVRVTVHEALMQLRMAIINRIEHHESALMQEILQMEAWLTPHSAGYIELDYGIASRILKEDDSPRDMAVFMDALAAGDETTMSIAYARLEKRWDRVRAALGQTTTHLW